MTDSEVFGASKIRYDWTNEAVVGDGVYGGWLVGYLNICLLPWKREILLAVPGSVLFHNLLTSQINGS